MGNQGSWAFTLLSCVWEPSTSTRGALGAEEAPPPLSREQEDGQWPHLPCPPTWLPLLARLGQGLSLSLPIGESGAPGLAIVSVHQNTAVVGDVLVNEGEGAGGARVCTAYRAAAPAAWPGGSLVWVVNWCVT